MTSVQLNGQTRGPRVVTITGSSGSVNLTAGTAMPLSFTVEPAQAAITISHGKGVSTSGRSPAPAPA